MQHFHYVDAHCGAGKTMKLVDIIATRHLLHSHRIIIASPTKVLVNQTARNLRKCGIANTIIHGGTACKSVMAKYEAALLDERKRVILVTHLALFAGINFAKNGDFKLFVDEIPQIDSEHIYKLKNNKKFVLDAFAITPFGSDPEFCEVTVKSSKLVNRYVTSQYDDIDAVLHSLASAVSSPNFHVACKAETYNRFTDQTAPSENFLTSAIMRPTIFSRWPDVTIMGANFTNSALYRCWLLDDATFEPHPLFTGLSAVHPTAVGDRIRIGYFFDQPFAKNQIHTFGSLGVDVIAEMGRIAEREFDGARYLATFNNRTNEASTDTFENAEVIEPVAKGRNDLTHLHRAIYAMAANDSPAHISMMKALSGFEGDELYLAHGFESAYQFLCRTSVRDAASTEPLHFLVPDKRTASMLADIFSCQNLYKIDHEMVLPKREEKPRKSKKEINRDYYLNAKAKKPKADRKLTANTFKEWVNAGRPAEEGQRYFVCDVATDLDHTRVKATMSRNSLLFVANGSGQVALPLASIVTPEKAYDLAATFATHSDYEGITLTPSIGQTINPMAAHVNKNKNDLIASI